MKTSPKTRTAASPPGKTAKAAKPAKLVKAARPARTGEGAEGAEAVAEPIDAAGESRAAAPARASIRDVAEAAGVSLKTVSRVINEDAAVRPEMRERVRQAIAALNYQSDPLARSLRGTHSFALGLVYSNPNAHYLVSLQNGVLSACREQGYGLQIHPCGTPALGSIEELLALVRRSRLAGLVLAPPMSEQRDLVQALAAHGVAVIRIVSAGDDPRDMQDCVRVDDRRAAHAVTEHLIQLGHSRISFLWGEGYYESSVQRYAGYMDAMRDYGVEVDPQLVLEGEFNFNSGFLRARKRSQATSTLETCRMIDAAKDQYAIENGKSAGMTEFPLGKTRLRMQAPRSRPRHARMELSDRRAPPRRRCHSTALR